MSCAPGGYNPRSEPCFEARSGRCPSAGFALCCPRLGTAAALSAAGGVEPKSLDVKLLQERLVAQGAEIGQSRRSPEVPK